MNEEMHASAHADPILIEKQTGRPAHEALYWLRYEKDEHPYGYVRRIGGQWWAAIPGGYGEYHKTRTAAIASLI